VPGFNSSKDEAWGSFIPLIKKDKDFNEYDIYAYGYPQQVCGQKNDIRDVGAHLKSILMEEIHAYDTTIFVAHSMGGLVVLHALLELDGSDFRLVNNKSLLVMSLGTPYYGATMASVFGVLCRNPQGAAMQVLKKEGARLMQDWHQRFNKPAAEADRRTANIPVHPFYGLNDELVEQASACGIDPGICESLDGDHSSIAKPPDREHLTYRKLQSLKDKAGIKLSGQESIDLDDLKVHVLFECDYKPFINMIPPEGGPKVAMFFASSPSIRHTSTIQDLGIPGQANLFSDPEKNGGRGHVCQIIQYLI
jgi:pimeloyl-ACP methyl ester carboxylesterase